jgi:hypothetical protein
LSDNSSLTCEHDEAVCTHEIRSTGVKAAAVWAVLAGLLSCTQLRLLLQFGGSLAASRMYRLQSRSIMQSCFKQLMQSNLMVLRALLLPCFT